MNQDIVNWISKEIREYRIQSKRLLKELHQEINSGNE